MPRSFTLSVCRALLRAASALVPGTLRREWVEEWHAELLSRWNHLQSSERLSIGSRVDLVMKSLGAVTHAVWLAGRDWRPSTMWYDLRLTIRGLIKKPAFTLITLGSLTLGIGANSLIYSVVDGLILNPFPFPDGKRLVVLGVNFPRLGGQDQFFEAISAPEYGDIRSQSETLENFVAYDLGNRDLGGVDLPQRLFTGFFWGDAFETLDMRPALGRGFLQEEIDQAVPVAVISYRVWQSRFGGDSSLVGESITVNGQPYTLVGIMPPRLLLFGTDLWMPMWASPEVLSRNQRQFNIVARVKPNHRLDDVNTELAAIAGRVEQTYGSEFPEYAGWRVIAEEFNIAFSRFVGPAGLIVLGAVAFVLLLACVNIGNLLLARWSGKQRELAVRAALGAGRSRLAQQLLAESLLLAVVGGALGLALAQLGIGTAVALIPENLIPGSSEFGLNHRVLGFTAVVTLGSGLIFGLLPAWQGSKTDLQQTMNSESGRTTSGASTLRLRQVFIVVQTAIAVVLLTGAGLLLKSFSNLKDVDTGFDSSNTLTMRITLQREQYRPADVAPFFISLLDRVERAPGVLGAAVTSQFPPSEPFDGRLRVEGAEYGDEESLPVTLVTIASANYPDVLGLRLISGRKISETDNLDTPLVVLVNESFMRRYFPDGDARGRRIAGSDGQWRTVVGVVSDARNRGIQSPVFPEVFLPLRQSGGFMNQLFLLARTGGDAIAALPAIRAAVKELDPNIPVYAVQTLEERMSTAVAPQNIAMTVLTCLGVVALGLAAMGIYGVLSSWVTNRTREVGVRIALGAQGREIRLMVLLQVIKMVGVGVVVGLVSAIALSRTLQSLLFNVSGTDIVSLTGAVIALSVVALIAGLVPAARAANLDPVVALREE